MMSNISSLVNVDWFLGKPYIWCSSSRYPLIADSQVFRGTIPPTGGWMLSGWVRKFSAIGLSVSKPPTNPIFFLLTEIDPRYDLLLPSACCGDTELFFRDTDPRPTRWKFRALLTLCVPRVSRLRAKSLLPMLTATGLWMMSSTPTFWSTLLKN